MYKSNSKKFSTLHEYFNHVADSVGVPRVHHHFETDSVLSDGLKLHLDVFEYSLDAPTIVFIPGTAIYAMCYAELLYGLGQNQLH